MWPALLGVGSSILSGLGSYFGQSSANAANAKEAARTREFNAAEAEKNRAFQADQSATAYQRKVKDLLAAGLNPALAYEGGGAQAMSGSAASGTPARFESAAGAGVSSAQRAVDLKSVVEQRAQQRAQSAAQVSETLARTKLTNAQADQVGMYMGAGLRELEARGDSSAQAATRAAAEAANIRQTLEARMALMQAQTLSATASADAARALVPMRGHEATLLELGIPAARNAAGAANTVWGRNVSPYLNDAKVLKTLFTPWR